MGAQKTLSGQVILSINSNAGGVVTLGFKLYYILQGCSNKNSMVLAQK